MTDHGNLGSWEALNSLGRVYSKVYLENSSPSEESSPYNIYLCVHIDGALRNRNQHSDSPSPVLILKVSEIVHTHFQGMALEERSLVKCRT